MAETRSRKSGSRPAPRSRHGDVFGNRDIQAVHIASSGRPGRVGLVVIRRLAIVQARPPWTFAPMSRLSVRIKLGEASHLFGLVGSVRVVVPYHYIQRTAGDGGLIILLRSFTAKASTGAAIGQASSPTWSSSQRSRRLRSIALLGRRTPFVSRRWKSIVDHV